MIDLEKQRTESLSKFYRSMGWTFKRVPSFSGDERWTKLQVAQVDVLASSSLGVWGIEEKIARYPEGYYHPMTKEPALLIEWTENHRPGWFRKPHRSRYLVQNDGTIRMWDYAKLHEILDPWLSWHAEANLIRRSDGTSFVMVPIDRVLEAQIV